MDMDWEQWFCPNQGCPIEVWVVRQSPDNREVWSIADRFGATSYSVAAVDPVCLCCGTTLCTTVEIGRPGGAEVLQAGPLLDFVRSLR
jgi:hypothetical protein